MKENLEAKDIVIIGAGPSGLTAAIYAYRANKDIVVLENQTVGGQIIWSSLIENYPGFPGGISGVELAQKMEEQVELMGIKIINGKVDSIEELNNYFIINTTKEKFKAKAAIIATGTTPRKLGILNEDNFIGKGVSFCATCDGPLYRGKDVAVIGGGNAACEEALFLAQFAKKVYLIHRRDELRAVPILQERIKENKTVELLYSYIPAEIIGSTKVESIKINDKKSDQIKELKVDGVFVFIGSIPNSEIIKGLAKTDENGFIMTDADMLTSKRGIFAAGDVRSKRFRQVVLACSEGAQAALCASKYIDEDSV